ncbi:hypothetical protein VMB_29030 [Vibrio mimicus VM603]|uniref:Uncharacterized protein n=1 Tax=Vibrio mimicus VM603 TaxID=671074 RepID=D2YHA6_VIBMI|nr:hypothetical protein VMB_29030 [Vibrio mimicus VM603]
MLIRYLVPANTQVAVRFSISSRWAAVTHFGLIFLMMKSTPFALSIRRTNVRLLKWMKFACCQRMNSPPQRQRLKSFVIAGVSALKRAVSLNPFIAKSPKALGLRVLNTGSHCSLITAKPYSTIYHPTVNS